jgi:hypothetical protein
MAETTKRAKKQVAEAAPEPVTLNSVKGFEKDLTCRGTQFAIGETFTVSGPAKCCSNGFHACPDDVHPLAVFGYYAPGTSRYFTVVQSGDICRKEDDKAASTILTVNIEIGVGDLVKRAWDYVWARAIKSDESRSTGDQGAASSTGDQGAASSTGDQGAASSTGNQGAASSTGDQGAASSTGYRGAASSTGDQGAAMASGYAGKVMGADGNALFAVERDENYTILSVASAIVGNDGIKAGVWYTCRAGKLVEA